MVRHQRPTWNATWMPPNLTSYLPKASFSSRESPSNSSCLCLLSILGAHLRNITSPSFQSAGLPFAILCRFLAQGSSPDHADTRCGAPLRASSTPTRQVNAMSPHTKFRKCYPYELNADADWTYKAISDAIVTLTALSQGRQNISITYDKKTLEYDLAFHNYQLALLVTESCTNAHNTPFTYGRCSRDPRRPR